MLKKCLLNGWMNERTNKSQTKRLPWEDGFPDANICPHGMKGRSWPVDGRGWWSSQRDTRGWRIRLIWDLQATHTSTAQSLMNATSEGTKGGRRSGVTKPWGLRQTAGRCHASATICDGMAHIMASSQVLLERSNEMLPVKGPLKTM